MTPDKTLGLYIHVPFCLKKCGYCDFYSAPAGEAERARYVAALTAHLRAAAPRTAGHTVDTVYIGGGTPTLLTAAQLTAILDTVRGYFDLSPAAEISIECNPATGSEELFRALARAGVNRVSIGVQSVHENELRALGRLHTYDDFTKTLAAVRAAGIENVNADAMYGIPEQTEESLRQTLETLAALPLTHLSVYGLRVEENTPFGRMGGALSLPSEDEQADMANLTADTLKAAGFTHYEISNYARNGAFCRHNLHYWHAEEYLGFGPGAHSYFGGVRCDIPRDRAAYVAAVEAGEFGALAHAPKVIAGREAREEYVMLRMRLFEGVDTADFEARFGVPFEGVYGPLDGLIEGGYLTRGAGRVAFTEKGMLVSNTILSLWLDFSEQKEDTP